MRMAVRMMSCEIHPAILEYIELVEAGEPRACKDQIALVRHVRQCFENEEIYTDAVLLEKYISLEKYFPFALFPWEKFLIGLWDCTFWRETGRPRWKTVFAMMGRGAGKDGFIAFDSACSVSPYNPVQGYNVDICANNEEQATRPLLDFVEVLETPKFEAKLKKHYYHTKETAKGRVNRGAIKGHTNNPKGRDGLRPGKIIFNEVHQYENYDNIEVFTTALGKVGQPRVGFFTSNGEVSDGPLDDYLERSNGILFEGVPDDGFLPFVCRLDEIADIHDEANWGKANPSLQYRQDLFDEIREEYNDWLKHPDQNGSLITKRFGIRSGKKEIAVTDYEKVKATNKPLINLAGCPCTVGIDYAQLSDWAAVNLHFRVGEQRYDINHAWICSQSKTLHLVKPPWRQWVADGHCTLVDDVSIHPKLLADYIREAAGVFQIKKLAADNFRWTAISEELKKLGFDARDKDKVKLIRPSDIMQVDPVIQDLFDRELFHWDNNPCLRWSVNNTKRVRSGRATGTDTGNYYYAKIEAKSRKTDPFMALVASMVIEPALGSGMVTNLPDVSAMAFNF